MEKPRINPFTDYVQQPDGSDVNKMWLFPPHNAETWNSFESVARRTELTGLVVHHGVHDEMPGVEGNVEVIGKMRQILTDEFGVEVRVDPRAV